MNDLFTQEYSLLLQPLPNDSYCYPAQCYHHHIQSAVYITINGHKARIYGIFIDNNSLIFPHFIFIYRRTCSARTSINHVFYISSSKFIVGTFAGLKKRSCHRFHHTDKVTFITLTADHLYCTHT